MDAERLVVRHCLRLVGLMSGTQGLNKINERTLKGGFIGRFGVEWRVQAVKGAGNSTDSG